VMTQNIYFQKFLPALHNFSNTSVLSPGYALAVFLND
jgi:hypothetical protein